MDQTWKSLLTYCPLRRKDKFGRDIHDIRVREYGEGTTLGIVLKNQIATLSWY